MKAFFYEVVYPGEGYRLLNIGEIIVKGDDVSLMVRNEPIYRKWKSVGEQLFGNKVNTPDMSVPYGYYRRKITN